jgi:L-alanine-DL-glutamate epimerase-like enolase superfamily enzyme
MNILSATVYALTIPFVDAFRHRSASRACSDSIVVRLVTDDGHAGYGEALPRSYVTGETRQGCINELRDRWLPFLLDADLSGIGAADILSEVPRLLGRGGFAGNAAKGAVELALIDCLLRSSGGSLASILPPRASEVIYSGVISSGPAAKVEKIAARFKSDGFLHVKLKVESPNDLGQVALIREIMGSDVSLRLDANGAFDFDGAVGFVKAVAAYDIQCIEQPIPRCAPQRLAELRGVSPVPIMVDESLVSVGDAQALIEHQACDYFNLRLSKLGGIGPTLAVAAMAADSGIGLQLGCMVGETAILSAAGRHMAAHLDKLRFVEGSYGTHLLIEDIADEDITFGSAGRAPLLGGTGLGISVREELLQKYAEQVLTVLPDDHG